MARQRMLHPKFFTDGRICSLPPLTRLLFQGLWCEADREGRLADEPVELKIRLLPLDQVDVDAALNALDRSGLIQRYASEGRGVIQVCNFLRYQKPHLRESPSVFAKAGKRHALAGAEHNLGTTQPGGVGVGVGVGVGDESESESVFPISPQKAQSAGPPLQAALLEADVTQTVKRAVKDAKKNTPDPRHAPLVARLVEAARRVLGSYAFTPRDAKAASELLHKGTDEEVEARLVKAFAAGGYPSVRTIHELNAHWNHFAVEKPQAFKRENRGPIDAATQKHDPKGGRIDF